MKMIAIFSKRSEAVEFIMRSKFNYILVEINGLYEVRTV